MSGGQKPEDMGLDQYMKPSILKDNATETVTGHNSAEHAVSGSVLASQGERTERSSKKPAVTIDEHTVEIVSDSGEGAQKCGQSFGSIAARMGNGIWTVEIIPAEIQPPARSIEGASGSRIRLGSHRIRNGGDEADLVVAFNDQVLLRRAREHELNPGCIVLLESKWKASPDTVIAEQYAEAISEMEAAGYQVNEVPMEQECLRLVKDPRRGKNMFVLGMLCSIYSLDLQLAREQIAFIFKKKSDAVIKSNIQLLEAGHAWAEENLEFKFHIPPAGIKEQQIVINGNVALGLGIMASGMEICSMYPITPATSVSHYLSEVIQSVGGMVHQAEDEIAACAFAIGASYAGKCPVTITSGPGFSLKQETLGLAVMAEIPLVVVNVQRGGPSTGLPTKTEQGDLLFSCFGGHGDAPRVVMAAADIEDCFWMRPRAVFREDWRYTSVCSMAVSRNSSTLIAMVDDLVACMLSVLE